MKTLKDAWIEIRCLWKKVKKLEQNGGGGGIQSIQEGDNISIDNTDPQNPIISALGGGVIIFTEVTKSQLDTLITNEELVEGTLYKITEAERWMLLGESTKALYLHATAPNKLETKGHGEFYVPKYDQNIYVYGIWAGEVMNAFPSMPPITYSINDQVIWGGRLWTNLTGAVGTADDKYTLDSTNWVVVPFDTVNYNIDECVIEYDYTNDMVIYRKDKNGNEVSTSYENWNFWENDVFDGNPLGDSLWNPTKVFQWGNWWIYDNNKGIGFNKLIDSVLECINAWGSVYYNTLNNSSIYNNTLGSSKIFYNNLSNSFIYDNILSIGSTINNNTLSDDSNINNNTLDNSSINDNILKDNNRIFNNTLSNVSTIGNNTLSNINDIYNNTLDDSFIKENILENRNLIRDNTLENNGSISSNTLSNSDIRNNTFNSSSILYSTLESSAINLGFLSIHSLKSIRYTTFKRFNINNTALPPLTTATTIFDIILTKEVYTRPDGEHRISYYDNTDTEVIVPLDN